MADREPRAHGRALGELNVDDALRLMARDTVPRLFGLTGDAWIRHANPMSVWTRFAILPFLALAIWSRTWIGWWCLLPIGLLCVWLVVNPLFFERPGSTRHWASRSVLGERLWSGDRTHLPPEFRSAVPTIAELFQVLGLAVLVFGLIDFDVIATVTGVVIIQLAKFWYLDRMVLMFDAVKRTDRDVASWEY